MDLLRDLRSGCIATTRTPVLTHLVQTAQYLGEVSSECFRKLLAASQDGDGYVLQRPHMDRRICVTMAPYYRLAHMYSYGPRWSYTYLLCDVWYCAFLWSYVSAMRCPVLLWAFKVLLLWSLASPVLCPVLTQAYTPCIILCRSASAISLFSHAPAVHIVLLTRYAYGPRPKRVLRESMLLPGVSYQSS